MSSYNPIKTKPPPMLGDLENMVAELQAKVELAIKSAPKVTDIYGYSSLSDPLLIDHISFKSGKSSTNSISKLLPKSSNPTLLVLKPVLVVKARDDSSDYFTITISTSMDSVDIPLVAKNNMNVAVSSVDSNTIYLSCAGSSDAVSISLPGVNLSQPGDSEIMVYLVGYFE